MDENELEKLSKHKKRQLLKQLNAEKVSADAEKAVKVGQIKKYALYAVVAVVLVGIVFVLFSVFNKPVVGENAKIELSSTSSNLGNVSVRGGTVSTSFTVSNTGEDDLVIEKMESSCMCTSAKIYFNGRESPLFGMHSKPSFWTETIPPGESAELKIFYDPTAHPDLRGAVTRVVTIYSNDSLSPQKDVKIQVNQVD